MNEGIFNIQLIKWPGTHSNHGEKETDKSNLGNGGECVTIIRTINLSISFSNQAGLKAINLTIKTNLNCVNPTTTNGNLPNGKTTRSQVSVECRVVISSIIACRQPGWERASLVFLGREIEDIVETNVE